MFQAEEIDHRSLYTRIGGPDVVDSIIDEFYGNVMADERINHFFAGLPPSRFKSHQTNLLMHMFGGRSKGFGIILRDAHADLIKHHGLTPAHFDAMIEDLMAALKTLDLSHMTTVEILSIARSTKDDIFSD